MSEPYDFFAAQYPEEADGIPVPEPFENLDEWEDSIEEREDVAFEMTDNMYVGRVDLSNAKYISHDEEELLPEPVENVQEVYDPWEGETDPENPLDELANENEELERVSDLTEREDALKAVGYGYQECISEESADESEDESDPMEAKLQEVQELELEARKHRALKTIHGKHYEERLIAKKALKGFKSWFFK